MNDPPRIEKLRSDHVVVGFDCGSEDLNRFLMRFALTNQQAGFRRAWGLPPRDQPRDWFSPLAQVWQQPREFEFTCRLPPHVHCIGPLTDPRPAHACRSRSIRLTALPEFRAGVFMTLPPV